MPRDSTDFFLRQLLAGASFEMVGSDSETGLGYRATVRQGDMDVAAFARIDSAVLRSAIQGQEPLEIGATLYRIDRMFGPEFLQAVRKAARIDSISATIQSAGQVICFIAKAPSQLAEVLDAYLPSTLQWDQDSFDNKTRDWGRKTGLAAKDLVGLRNASFSVERLQMLERSGESEVYEAVSKDAVWPSPTLQSLRVLGMTPIVAFGIVSCWRMVKTRPARNPLSRLAFVRDLPRLRADFERCITLEDFAAAVNRFIDSLASDSVAVVGARMRRFAQRLGSVHAKYFSRQDVVLRSLLAINSIKDVDAQWVYADEKLSSHTGDREPPGPPLPSRPSLPVEQLMRSGPNLPEPPTLDRVSSELGITGLELGNYVSQREGEYLSRLLAEAFADLRHVLGNWIVPICRSGNLSVALGARGKGKSSAHYEPALRVINLTKMRGDGSLAHEFGHFLDHMLAAHANGESRFLSARVYKLHPTAPPIAAKMTGVMKAITSSPRLERITGEIKPPRWFYRSWMQKRGYDDKSSPQLSFDRVADTEPHIFRGGREARAKSVTLVNTMAKIAQSPVEVEIRYDAKTNFVEQARKLGPYWVRPEELFARAFESFLEDELTRRSWRSEYLVFGTQRDYQRCRGEPYPAGSERERIAQAIRDLLGDCASEGTKLPGTDKT